MKIILHFFFSNGAHYISAAIRGLNPRMISQLFYSVVVSISASDDSINKVQALSFWVTEGLFNSLLLLALHYEFGLSSTEGLVS